MTVCLSFKRVQPYSQHVSSSRQLQPIYSIQPASTTLTATVSIQYHAAWFPRIMTTPLDAFVSHWWW